MRDWREDIVSRLKGRALRPEAEFDLVEELSQHLDEHFAELRAQGVPEEEARVLALAELDAMDVTTAAREKARPWRGTNEPLGGARGEGFGAVWSDLRFGARLLVRNPGLTIAAILTLGIGIGANTAIFSAVNAVLLKPLPFPASNRLYKIWESNPEKGWYKQVAAPANYLDWKEGVPGFEDVAAYTDAPAVGGSTLLGEGEPQLIRDANVTGNFFRVMGVPPIAGRVFRDDETWQGKEPVLVMSENVWRTKFGARPIIDHQIRLGSTSYRVVGIMPASFEFPRNAEVWLPMQWDPATRTAVWFRRAHWINVVGRAKRGVSADRLDQQLQTVVKRLQHDYPETNRVMGAGMTPLHEFIVGNTNTPLLVLLFAVGLLLLIACANVGNLLLVKATARGRELAVRRALGASAMRLTRQLLTEGIVLASAGSAAGIAAGYAFTRVLERMQPPGLLAQSHFSIDRVVLGYVVLVTIVAGLIFGMIPALSLRRSGPARVMADSSRTGAPGRGARRTANLLIVAEVAIAVMLVIGGGLLLRTFHKLQQVESGVDSRGTLVATVALQSSRYDSASVRLQFYHDLEARARALPGVKAVTISSNPPLSGSSYTSDFAVAGRGREDYGSEIGHRMVTPSYFETVKVPVLMGRDFTNADVANSTPVVIINKVTADKYFRDMNPIGQRLTFDKYPDSTSVWRTIIGVSGNEHQRGLDVEPALEAFVPLAQETDGSAAVLLRTDGDPLALTPGLRAAMHEIDPDLALQSVTTLEKIRADSLGLQRFLMTILLVFAAVALVLAVVGVYGVTSQGTRQRRQEIGVRLAMGADARNIILLVVRQSASLILLGVVSGCVLALLATRALSSLLFGISAADPVTYACVAGALLFTGVVAAWVPARSASRSDPASVLRVE